MLANGTNAPRSTARPPTISTRIVSHPIRCGAGTPRACKIAGNASGPLASLAKQCCMKPYPTISRSGIGAQRAIGDLLIRSRGRPRQFGDGLWVWHVERVSMITLLATFVPNAVILDVTIGPSASIPNSLPSGVRKAGRSARQQHRQFNQRADLAVGAGG